MDLCIEAQANPDGTNASCDIRMYCMYMRHLTSKRAMWPGVFAVMHSTFAVYVDG